MDEKNYKDVDNIADQLNGGLQENDVSLHDDHTEGSSDFSAASSVSADVTEVEKLKKDIEEYKDKYIRLVADFDNFRRRNAKERIELIQTAGKEIIGSLLEVLDDCDRAEKQLNTSNDLAHGKEGVQLVFSKLRSTLYAKGLKPMESLHTDFDVEKHEAITEIEVAEKKLQGKVIDEVVKGYYLNEKLIRFAKVVIGK